LNNKQKISKKDNDMNGTTENSEKIPEVAYPHNVTLRNFLDFLLVPTLVYELNYPRTPQIRWTYLLEKVLTFLGLQYCIHLLVDGYIVPILEQSPNLSILESIAHLITPFSFVSLLLFYTVFEVACNGFAELTRFADREFYQDWWNSKGFDEFSRKWNKPVHTWLLRHVYVASMDKSSRFSLDKQRATVWTFVFSSIVHELFLAIVMRMFYPWFFFFQMSQIPLIFWIGRYTRKHQRGGNLFFWFGMILGPPLISLLYCREYYLQGPTFNATTTTTA